MSIVHKEKADDKDISWGIEGRSRVETVQKQLWRMEVKFTRKLLEGCKEVLR